MSFEGKSWNRFTPDIYPYNPDAQAGFILGSLDGTSSSHDVTMERISKVYAIAATVRQYIAMPIGLADYKRIFVPYNTDSQSRFHSAFHV